VELIKYYEQNYLYKKIKLWFPVNEDIVQRMGTVSMILYTYIEKKKLRVRITIYHLNQTYLKS